MIFMSTFSLGGKTKILFSKIGLLLFLVVISLAIIGACVQKPAAGNTKQTTAAATATGLISPDTDLLAWFQA